MLSRQKISSMAGCETPAAVDHGCRTPPLAQVFDVAAVRAALEQRLKSLELELHQVGGQQPFWEGPSVREESFSALGIVRMATSLAVVKSNGRPRVACSPCMPRGPNIACRTAPAYERAGCLLSSCPPAGGAAAAQVCNDSLDAGAAAER